jgi:hypothetical protein
MQIAFSRSIAFPRVPELIPTLPQVADSLRVTLTILRLRNYLCNGDVTPIDKSRPKIDAGRGVRQY